MGERVCTLDQRVPGPDIEMRCTPLFLTERSLVAAQSTELDLEELGWERRGSALALGGRVFKTGGQLLAPAGGAALEAGVHPVNGAVRF